MQALSQVLFYGILAGGAKLEEQRPVHQTSPARSVHVGCP